MRRLLIAPLVAALALVSTPAQLAQAEGSSTTGESGSPINDQGSSYHYRTYITAITPHVHGLNVEVLEFADRLLLRNETGQTVTIYGYRGSRSPGAGERLGRAEQTLAPVYLNTNFYAQVTVPPSASATAAPDMGKVDRTGQPRMARPPHPLDVVR